MKKNEIMLFVSTEMDLDIITLWEVSQTKTNIISYCLYVESKMNLFPDLWSPWGNGGKGKG